MKVLTEMMKSVWPWRRKSHKDTHHQNAAATTIGLEVLPVDVMLTSLPFRSLPVSRVSLRASVVSPPKPQFDRRMSKCVRHFQHPGSESWNYITASKSFARPCIEPPGLKPLSFGMKRTTSHTATSCVHDRLRLEIARPPPYARTTISTSGSPVQ